MSPDTYMLNSLDAGDPNAANQLLKLVYEELRRLAAFKMAQQPAGQTLQATALVHEAWLKISNADNCAFKDRAHFFSAAAEAMRCILVDRARRKQTRRHGGGSQRVEFDDLQIAAPAPDDQLMELNEALMKLAKTHLAQAEVVKLRYFVGLTNEEVAQLLGLSVSTVKNYWNFARAWLFSEIRRE